MDHSRRGKGVAPARPPDRTSELAERARSSAWLIVVTALVVVPAWSAFDLVLEPDNARAFITLRAVCELPALVGAWLLRRHPGPRRPELVAVAVLCVVQCEIAWMVSRASSNREFYLLGFTLALYGSGLLLTGGARWTLLLVGVSVAAFALCVLLAPEAVAGSELVAAATYLGTSGVISVLAHVQRDRLTRREFESRARLEQEQLVSRDLLVRLEQQSHEDPLTGLANRRRWDEQLVAQCERARETGEHLAVVLLDVDHFKSINDRLGHAAGDEVLRRVSAVLVQRSPSGSVVARLGGDELALLLPGMDERAASALAERVRTDVRATALVGGSRVDVGVSQGVAAARGQAASVTALMSLADSELYRAKKDRDSVCSSRVPDLAIVPSPRGHLRSTTG
ncbi:MAG: GGDEF domain-containing protein [Mycobacteriales bacterium]|nr:GGDEF domain-containing protein [Mycobacteriales bacterium]